MKRNRPVPKFEVSIARYDDGESQKYPPCVIVEASFSNDVSLGFITLDAPSDLYALRDAIDEFLIKNRVFRPRHHRL